MRSLKPKAKYLVILATITVLVIDITEYWGGSATKTYRLTLFESFIDILFILSTYWLLKSEIKLRKKSQIDLTESNIIKTKFINMAAHDLRNPIGAIQGFATILEEKTTLDEETAQIIKRIKKISEEVLNLVNNLLNVSVIEQKGLSLKKEKVDLTDLAQEILFNIQPKLKQKKQKVLFESAEKVKVNCDRLRIKQVFLNIITNAIKYSPVESEIKLELKTNDHSAIFKVTDLGPGLLPDEITKIFDVFSSIKKTPTGGEISTGLGLSISKSIVTAHNGKISVESEGLGKGAQFIVELPIV